MLLPFYVAAQPLDESVSYLSNYILSQNFASIRVNQGDLAAVDSLYKEALHYHENDISEALLTTAFASLAFQTLPICIPLINVKLELDLAYVDKELFAQKIESIPKHIFFNSPKNNFGDKDKVAHFFGSAYLSNSVTIFKLSKFMGIFVEFFEAAFKVNGSLDLRDIAVDNLGELFGNGLRENPNILPSDALKIYNLFYFKLTN
jgi:hypothetical protein